MTSQRQILTENINITLSYFSGQEFLFPRSIMTSKTNSQVFVDSEDQIIRYFEEANFADCRLNGYPYHHKDERPHLYPSFIFVDLDLSLCSTCKYPIRKLDYILKQTLLKIQEEIHGYPTVLWTGNGYHIYQPIKIVTEKGEKLPLDSFKEFEEFVPILRNDLCTEFIRFANKYFTNGKGDPKHNPSIYSCLIRIPGTINSKNAETVKIVQKWNDVEALANPLILPFVEDLKQRKSEIEESSKRRDKFISKNSNNRIAWIDKLLQNPLSDHRYFCLWRILIPYLVTIKGLPEHEVIAILNEWLDKCNDLNKIKWKYPQKIKDQLRHDKGYAPISLANLKKENIQLYMLLQNR